MYFLFCYFAFYCTVVYVIIVFFVFHVACTLLQVLLQMGFTHLELDNHFGGVAFLAWFVSCFLTKVFL